MSDQIAILRPSDGENLAGQNTGREHISHTRLSTFLACPRRYDLRYVERLESISRAPALSLGRAFHHAIEVRDPQAGANYLREHAAPSTDQASEDKLRIDEATVAAGATYYLARWQPLTDERRETEYRVQLRSPWTGAYSRSFDLVGVADGVLDCGSWLELVEDKFLGALTEQGIRRLTLDRQISLACYALWRATGKSVRRVHYRIVRKPSIKQRKDETVDEFCERIAADYADPARRDFYGHEEQLFRGTDDLLRVEAELWEWARQMREQRRQRLFARNTSACLDFGGCEFLPICLGDEDARALYRVRPERDEAPEPIAA